MEAGSRKGGARNAKTLAKWTKSADGKAFAQARSMQAEANKSAKQAQRNASSQKRAQEKASGQKLAF